MFEQLRSSPRKLAGVFYKSRESWKARAEKQRLRAKALDGKARDLSRSRDRWKAKAQQLKQQLRAVERGATGQPVHAQDSAGTGRGLVVATTVPATSGGQSAAPPFCPRRGDKASRSISCASPSSR